MNEMQYPIGPFRMADNVTPALREGWIRQIAETPARMREAVAGLSAEHLNTPYRPGGWTVRQVVHHVPDSHTHSYVRFKWTLTEARPSIKAYDQDGWAALPDVAATPIGVSLDLLEAFHRRWVAFLEGLTDADYARTFVHPDLGEVSLVANLAYYAWHGRHHVA